MVAAGATVVLMDKNVDMLKSAEKDVEAVAAKGAKVNMHMDMYINVVIVVCKRTLL